MFSKLKKIIKSAKNNDRGIAILFTLGILSLLLIMAMSFATDAIIERKVAYNNNTRTQARLLAKSAMNRAVAALKFYTETAPLSYNFEGITTDSPAVHSWNDDYADAIPSTLFAVLGGDKQQGVFSNLTKTITRWQYITDSSNGKLIGRFAYAVFEDSGRMDLAAATNTDTQETSASKVRFGVSPDEIYLAGLKSIPTTAIPTWTTATRTADLSDNELNILSHYNLTTNPSGKFPKPTVATDARWQSIEQVLSKNVLNVEGGTSASNENQSKRACLNRLFSIYTHPDIEAYWGAPGNPPLNTQKTLETMYHRFNLKRTDWDSMTVGKLLCTTTPTNDPVLFSEKVGTPTERKIKTPSLDSGIQYLKHMCTSSGTFATADDRRKQVAANIIDFCDTNSEPTSNVSPGSWSDALIPLYTGNECTLYINEVWLKANAVITNVTPIPDTPASGDTTYRHELTIYCYPCAELIDIYGGLVSSNYSLKIYGQCSYDAGGTTGTIALSPATINAGEFPALTNGFTYTEGASAVSSTALVVDTVNSTMPVKLSLSIKCAILNDGSSNVDYASINQASASLQQVYNGNGALTTNSLYLGVQTEDPRQNLHDADWPSAKTVTTIGSSYNGTPGANNTGVNPKLPTGMSPGEYDPEQTTSPNYKGEAENQRLSTAFIRNGAFDSPWQLGMIHRGAKWETINLKKFNKAISYENSGTTNGSYQDGDAGILDQVKMASDTTAYGKIDINMKNVDLLKALFYKLYIPTIKNSANPYVPGGENPPSTAGENVIEFAKYRELAQAIIDANLAANNGGAKYRHRAEIADEAAAQVLAQVSTATDVQQEAIVGKCINLAKAAEPPNEIRLLIVAQTIRDIGGTSATPITIYKVPPSGGAAISHSCVMGKFDYDLGSKTYFDEITGEQKLYAIISRNPVNNKYNIRRIEFINE